MRNPTMRTIRADGCAEEKNARENRIFGFAEKPCVRRERGEVVRNILITVMMLIVVALLFTSIVADSDGLKAKIEEKGGRANSEIGGLDAELTNP